MKYIPILFSTPMVQAILDGRKTQTRRTLKMPPKNITITENGFEGESGRIYKCPYGKAGDILWVRETWKDSPKQATWQRYSYKADYNSHLAELGKWNPSIHMPKSACRIFLKVKSVRVERLQDISEEDAKAEGADDVNCGVYGTTRYADGFYSIWNKINGSKSWDENPLVWVIEFERIEKPENFK